MLEDAPRRICTTTVNQGKVLTKTRTWHSKAPHILSNIDIPCIPRHSFRLQATPAPAIRYAHVSAPAWIAPVVSSFCAAVVTLSRRTPRKIPTCS